MTCKEVRKHQKENQGQIDLKWFEWHIVECPDCKATMEAATIVMEESLNEDED